MCGGGRTSSNPAQCSWSQPADRPTTGWGGGSTAVDKVLARKSSAPSHHHHQQQPPTTSLDCAGGAICGRPAGWEVGEETRRRRGAAERWQVFVFFSFLLSFCIRRDKICADCLVGHRWGRGGVGGDQSHLFARPEQTEVQQEKKKKSYSSFPNIFFFSIRQSIGAVHFSDC